MNQNKELKIFNNPLWAPADGVNNIIESNNEYTSTIKEAVNKYLLEYNLPSHKETRIIEATNKLLSLLK